MSMPTLLKDRTNARGGDHRRRDPAAVRRRDGLDARRVRAGLRRAVAARHPRRPRRRARARVRRSRASTAGCSAACCSASGSCSRTGIIDKEPKAHLPDPEILLIAITAASAPASAARRRLRSGSRSARIARPSAATHPRRIARRRHESRADRRGRAGGDELRLASRLGDVRRGARRRGGRAAQLEHAVGEALRRPRSSSPPRVAGRAERLDPRALGPADADVGVGRACAPRSSCRRGDSASRSGGRRGRACSRRARRRRLRARRGRRGRTPTRRIAPMSIASPGRGGPQAQA